MRLTIYSYIYRIHFHRFQIQVQPVMLNHPVAEHLPQDIAAELCQRGIDEQVLPVQCFRQRAAWTGVFFLYPRVSHETGDYFQGTDSFIQFGCRLFYFFRHRTHNDLSRGLRVSEIHPIQRGFVSAECRLWQSLQQVPQVYPGFDVVRTSDCDIGQMIPSGILQYGRIDVRLRLPVVAEEIIYPGDKALRLVLSQIRRPEQLTADVGFRHDVGVIQGHEQSRMSESSQCRIKPGQTG